MKYVSGVFAMVTLLLVFGCTGEKLTDKPKEISQLLGVERTVDFYAVEIDGERYFKRVETTKSTQDVFRDKESVELLDTEKNALWNGGMSNVKFTSEHIFTSFINGIYAEKVQYKKTYTHQPTPEDKYHIAVEIKNLPTASSWTKWYVVFIIGSVVMLSTSHMIYGEREFKFITYAVCMLVNISLSELVVLFYSINNTVGVIAVMVWLAALIVYYKIFFPKIVFGESMKRLGLAKTKRYKKFGMKVYLHHSEIFALIITPLVLSIVVMLMYDDATNGRIGFFVLDQFRIFIIGWFVLAALLILVARQFPIIRTLFDDVEVQTLHFRSCVKTSGPIFIILDSLVQDYGDDGHPII